MTFKTPTSFFSKFFCFFFLKVHLHHSSKIKSHKDVKNSRNQGFLFYLCLMKERSGSVPLTHGSGSGRTKNFWIRIRNTDFKRTILRDKTWISWHFLLEHKISLENPCGSPNKSVFVLFIFWLREMQAKTQRNPHLYRQVNFPRTQRNGLVFIYYISLERAFIVYWSIVIYYFQIFLDRWRGSKLLKCCTIH
jgi:hypothetical protein